MVTYVKPGVSISVIDYSPVIIINWVLLVQRPVDGVNWYTLMVSKAVSEWLKTQDPGLWNLHPEEHWSLGKIDVAEELFAIIKLKFYNTPDFLTDIKYV